MGTEGPIQVRGEEGIKALTAAVERSVRLKLLQAQIPAQIAVADAAVADAYASLGIPMPSVPKGKRATRSAPRAPREPRDPSAPFIPEPGSKAEAIWDLLPATIEGIAEITGLTKQVAAVTLANLSRYGHVRRDDSTDPPLWHRAGPPDAPETASPAFAGNGAAAE